MKVRRAVACSAALLASILARSARADDAAAPAEATPTYPTLRLIGFTDAGFSATDADGAASNSGFFQGQFVLHVSSALSSRLAFFGELSVVTSDDTAYAHGAATSSSSMGAYHAAADVHRTMLKYTHSDALKLSIGRFHTPVSYWNVTYHHGAWLQTTVTRPKMLDFSSPFLPLHFTGAFAEGDVPSGPLNLGYSLGIGNGRGGGPGRADAPGDVNNNRAWVARISSKPEWMRGFEIGGALYRDKVTAVYTNSSADYREWIMNGYFAFTKEKPEILAEYVAIRHDRIGRPLSHTSWAYYMQAAWRLQGLAEKAKPYVRWEEIRPNASDALMNAAAGCRGLLAGLRVDVSDFVALKAEYQHQQDEGALFHNGFFTQASFTF
jgi:hypothetical protein